MEIPVTEFLMLDWIIGSSIRLTMVFIIQDCSSLGLEGDATPIIDLVITNMWLLVLAATSGYYKH